MVCATAAMLIAPAALAQQGAPAAGSPPPVATPTPSPSRTPSVFTLPGVVPERYSLPGGTPVPVAPPPTTVSPVPIPTPTPSASVPSRRVEASRAERRPVAPGRPAAAPAPAPVPAPQATAPAVAPTPVAIQAPAPVPVQPGMPGWLWMLIGAAATAALGGGAWLFLRRRTDPDEEEAEPFVDAVPAPEPAPLLPRVSPTPQPQVQSSPPPPRPIAAPPAPTPQLHPFEVGIRPLRIELGERDVALDFELLIGNLQPEPAEAVRLSLAMMSASPDQDAILTGFHRGPPGELAGEPFDLAPGSGARMPGRLLLGRDRIHVVEVRGRPMFVAMMLVDLRWRSGLSIRRYGADFMIGAAGQGDRIGPIWLDRGQPMGPLGATRYLAREAVAA